MKKGRPLSIRISLTDPERRTLRKRARQKPGRVAERIRFVLLADKGKSAHEIAELMDYTPQTVYTWLKRYQQYGVDGLQDRPRPGRPRKERFLVGIVQAQARQSPPCFGYPFSRWTVASLNRHLKNRFGVDVSMSTVRRALRAAGFRWGRPQLALPKRRDPETEARLAHLREVLSATDGVVIAEDESELEWLPVIRAMWHRRGEQPRVPTPGQNQRRAIFGSVNLRSGQWHYQITERKRSEEFIGFLEDLLGVYRESPIAVVVDNASIHTSKKVREWLEAHPQVTLLFLPRYAGHHWNPAEKVWWAMKGHVVANRYFQNMTEEIQTVHRYFAQLTPQEVLRLTRSPLSRLAQAAR